MAELVRLAAVGDRGLLEEQKEMMEEFAYHAVVRWFHAHGYGKWAGLVKLPGEGKGASGTKCWVFHSRGLSPR